MKKSYTTPKAEKLRFDYTKIVTASYDPANNPAGKGFAHENSCTSGPPSGHSFQKKKCV